MSNADFNRGYVAGITEALELLRISASLGKNVKSEMIALRAFLATRNGSPGKTVNEQRGKAG